MATTGHPQHGRHGHAAGAGEAASVDALHAHGRLRRRGRADHRPRRRLLRLGRARQPLPRRPLLAVLLEPRARSRRHRARRRRAGRADRLLLNVVLRAPAGDRAGGEDRLAHARRPQPRLLHERRQRGGRVGAEARPRLPQAHRQSEQDEGHRARDRLPRHLARGALGDRHPRAAHAVRAAHARRLPRAEHERLPPARRASTRRRSPRRCAIASCSRAPRRSAP